MYFLQRSVFVRSLKFVIYVDYVSAYICITAIQHIRFGAEGQFMPAWRGIEPEFKPRRSRKRPIKMLNNRRKEAETNKKKEEKEARTKQNERDTKNGEMKKKKENQNKPTTKNRKDEKKRETLQKL